MDYFSGNVVKYICRYKEKNGLEDLLKAKWYLERVIKNMDINRLRESIIAHEGIRYKAYADPILGEVAMTTGVGHLIRLPLEEELLEKELSMEEVLEILEADINVAVGDAKKFIDEDSIPEEAFEIVVEMMLFNLVILV